MIFREGRFVAGDDVDKTAYETPVTYPEEKRSTAIMAIKIVTSSRLKVVCSHEFFYFSLLHLTYNDKLEADAVVCVRVEGTMPFLVLLFLIL